MNSINSLLVIPLGGVEEIGLNMTVFQYSDDLIVVDAGLMFPEEDMLGVDIVIPDFSYILENREKVRGIIITHGHEDHTGALPFLLKELYAASSMQNTRCETRGIVNSNGHALNPESSKVPVYGTPLTLALVREKLREHNIKDIPLMTVKPRDIASIGVFTVEFMRVTHSIVDGVGLGINTPLGSIIHTGDFKLDPTPVDGELMDFHKFSEYGEKGTLLMLSDSVNAGKGGFTFSEKEVRRAFEDIFTKAKGRIIIATFASNIHRIQQAIDVAVQFKRKVIMCGRSIVSNAQIALDLGYLKAPENTWVRLENLKDLPDHEVVIITTGSQGEPMSVISRIATDEHKYIKIKAGDTVILSATAIPGNERSIGKIINHLMRRGADVIYEKVSEVHVSGHASKEELKLMINLVKPKYFMPIHGEYRHLKYHAKLAEKSAIPLDNIFIMEDGAVLEITETGARKNEKVNSGRIFIDGKEANEVQDIVIRDRRRLAHDGIVIVLVGIERFSKRIVFGPEIISRGFVFEDASYDIINEVKELMASTLTGLKEDIISDDTSLIKAKLRATLKKYLRNTMNRKPMIMPIIIEV